MSISWAYVWHTSSMSQHMLGISRLVVKVGCQDGLSRLVVRIVVISSPSASSVSIFGIFPSIWQPDTQFFQVLGNQSHSFPNY